MQPVLEKYVEKMPSVHFETLSYEDVSWTLTLWQRYCFSNPFPIRSRSRDFGRL